MKFILILLLSIISIIIILIIISIIRTLLLKQKVAYYKLSEDNKRIDEYASKLSKMIQYETVSIRGEDQTKKFLGFHKVLESLFPNVFKKCEKIVIDGNIMMKWKGKNPSLDPIILISHQDVVEASGEWIYPPFSGTIVDGRIYGRGSGDIKSGVFSFYQAVEELILEGYQPNCDVYLGSSCTEEIGGDGAPKMVEWFKKHNIHLFLLSDEGGAITNNPVGGVEGSFAAIGIFEKGYGDLRIDAKSNGGHSSTPPKNTPIARLSKFISYVETHNVFKSKITPAFNAMFTNLAPYCSSFILKVIMHNMWLYRPLVAKLVPLISSEAAAMLKTTICFTMAKGSDGYNVIPQNAWVTANLRYIPFQNLDESNRIISNLASKYNLETSVVTATYPSKSLDLNGKQYDMTIKCINKVFPSIGIMPYIVTGGTDSRFFDDICDGIVKFSPIMIDSEQMKGMHGLNENIYTGTLPNAVDYYKELIKIQEER